MNRSFKFILGIFLLLIIPILGFSQKTVDDVEMADTLRSNGMIYIVVIVLLIIFLGLAAYLISIDRKVRRLESEKRK